MKRVALCLSCLFLFFVAACTLISGKIEEEMAVEVQLKTVGNFRNIRLPASVLFEDSTGLHLYSVETEIGWDAGLRIQEETGYLYSGGDYVTYDPVSDIDIVYAASRQPRVGETVNVIEEFSTSADTYLIFLSPDYSADTLPYGYTLLGRSETTVLVEVLKAESPFIENKVRGSLSADAQTEIISCGDVLQFCEQLPEAALLCTLVFVPFLLWILGIFRKGKPVFFANLFLSAAALTGIADLLPRLEFPSSVLPEKYIFDISHYRNLLYAVREGLAAIDGGGPYWDAIHIALKSAGSAAALCAIGGVLLICGTMLLTSPGRPHLSPAR